MNKLYNFLKKVHLKLGTDYWLVVYKNGDNKYIKIKESFNDFIEIEKNKEVDFIVFSAMSTDALDFFYLWILKNKSKKEIDDLLKTKRFDKSYFKRYVIKNYEKQKSYTLKYYDLKTLASVKSIEKNIIEKVEGKNLSKKTIEYIKNRFEKYY
jgi:hypothetical protein